MEESERYLIMRNVILNINVKELRDRLGDTDMDSRILRAITNKTFETQAEFKAAFTSGVTNSPDEIQAAEVAVSWKDSVHGVTRIINAVYSVNSGSAGLANSGDKLATYCFIKHEDLPTHIDAAIKQKVVEYVFANPEASENFTTAEALFNEVMADETGWTRWDEYLTGEWQNTEAQYALEWVYDAMKDAALAVLNS